MEAVVSLVSDDDSSCELPDVQIPGKRTVDQAIPMPSTLYTATTSVTNPSVVSVSAPSDSVDLTSAPPSPTEQPRSSPLRPLSPYAPPAWLQQPSTSESKQIQDSETDDGPALKLKKQSKTQSLKGIVVEAGGDLMNSVLAVDLQRELGAVGVKLISSKSIWPLLTIRCPNSMVKRGLLVLEVDTVSRLVLEHNLASHVANVSAKEAVPVTLVTLIPPQYYKRGKSGTRMTEVELEMAIVDMLVSGGQDAVVARTTAEVALLVLHTARSIADLPAKNRKREMDERAEMYMRSDSRQCVHVDADGRGLGHLWQQMLSVLPGASLETARALVREYPCPRSLQQATRDPDGVRRLAATPVVRAAGADVNARALGKEFARRLAIIMQAEDGRTPVA